MRGSRPQHAGDLDVHPLTSERFDDLVTLFSGRGGSQVRSCWCMCYRRSGRTGISPGMTFGEWNRRALQALVEGGVVPGLIGYRDGRPIAWVSLGPREQYRKLAKSPVMKPVDDKPVWSVVCFYTALEARNAGISAAMLAHAARFARANGARLLEAYPVDRTDRAPDNAMWFGAKRMYDAAGFREVARRKPGRPIVRKTLRPS